MKKIITILFCMMMVIGMMASCNNGEYLLITDSEWEKLSPQERELYQGFPYSVDDLKEMSAEEIYDLLEEAGFSQKEIYDLQEDNISSYEELIAIIINKLCGPELPKGGDLGKFPIESFIGDDDDDDE